MPQPLLPPWSPIKPRFARPIQNSPDLRTFPTGARIQITRPWVHYRRTKLTGGIRGPVVVNPPSGAPTPVEVRLARTPLARQAKSVSRPPTVVNPAASAVAPRLKASLARAPLQGLRKSRLQPPSIVFSAADVANFSTGARIQLTRGPARPLTGFGFVTSPAYLVPVAAAALPVPLKVRLAPASTTRPWVGFGYLSAPASVNPAPAVTTAFGSPVAITIAAPRPRPGVGLTRVYRPTIVTAAAAFKPPPLRSKLAPSVGRPTTGFGYLASPAIVSPAAVPTLPAPLKIRLAKASIARPNTGFSYIASPTTINPAPSVTTTFTGPLAITLAPAPTLHAGQRSLRKPTVLAPFSTTTLQQRTPRLTLARWQWRVPASTTSAIYSPVVMVPYTAPTLDQRTAKVTLTWAPRLHSGQHDLRKPGPFVTSTLQQRTPKVTLARRQWQIPARPTSEIYPPIVLRRRHGGPPRLSVTDWAGETSAA